MCRICFALRVQRVLRCLMQMYWEYWEYFNWLYIFHPNDHIRQPYPAPSQLWHRILVTHDINVSPPHYRTRLVFISWKGWRTISSLVDVWRTVPTHSILGVLGVVCVIWQQLKKKHTEKQTPDTNPWNIGGLPLTTTSRPMGRPLGMGSAEGVETASTGSVMKNAEPSTTIQSTCIIQSIKRINPGNTASTRSIYSRNTVYTPEIQPSTVVHVLPPPPPFNVFSIQMKIELCL